MTQTTNETDEIRVGDTVEYTFYGVEETGTVVNIGGPNNLSVIIVVDNGKKIRWMHRESVSKKT